jgi:anti-sigma factor RsiW
MTDMNDSSSFPDEALIHAYVDGRLDDATRVRMEAWLDRHPDRAGEIRQWQRDAQQLRVAFGGPSAWSSPEALDPARIRARHRNRVRARVALTAALLLALVVGGAGGWQAREFTVVDASPPMADALEAYRMFALRPHVQFDVTQQHVGELQVWLDRHFRHADALPDLAGTGFPPVGGRLLATDSGPAAMVLYEDGQGRAISFYIRPPSSRGTLPHGERRDGRLAAAYWSGNGYNYALVSRADATDVRVIREASQRASI